MSEPEPAGRVAAELTSRLAPVAVEARRRWPGIGLGGDAFAAHVAERLPDDSADLSAFAIDLFLSCACLAGDVIALRAFDVEVLGKVDPVLRRIGLSASDADDVKQEVRARLLVCVDGEPGRLATYSGTGPLRHWVAAVAGRQALAVMRRTRPHAEFDEDQLDDGHDPRLRALRSQHRSEFKGAFQQAVAELEPRDRAVLRALVVDDRSVGEIASVYGIHRVTASRWIARIRYTLLTATRRQLRRMLPLSEVDLDEVLVLDSTLDFSLHRLLADAA